MNTGYTIFIMILIGMGYFVQFETCFRRDRAGEGLVSLTSSQYTWRVESATNIAMLIVLSKHFFLISWKLWRNHYCYDQMLMRTVPVWKRVTLLYAAICCNHVIYWQSFLQDILKNMDILMECLKSFDLMMYHRAIDETADYHGHRFCQK